MNGWKDEVMRYSAAQTTIILVGNKTDKASERVITYEEGKVRNTCCVVKHLPLQGFGRGVEMYVF